MRQLDLMSIGQLLAVIRQQPEGSDLRERALRRCLDELIEVEITWRIDHRHLNQGYHKASTIAGIGEGSGEVTGCVDHVGEAAERYRHACRWRAMAQALLGHLNERQRMALLLCGYAIPEQRCAVLGGNEARMQLIKQGSRALTLAEVCEGQRVILKRLGWPMGDFAVVFPTRVALRDVAIRAKKRLVPAVSEQAALSTRNLAVTNDV